MAATLFQGKSKLRIGFMNHKLRYSGVADPSQILFHKPLSSPLSKLDSKRIYLHTSRNVNMQILLRK